MADRNRGSRAPVQVLRLGMIDRNPGSSIPHLALHAPRVEEALVDLEHKVTGQL